MAKGEVLLRVTLDDIRPALDALEAEFRKVCAERGRLRAAIEFVLADAESEQPHGWGPDVTMVAVLKKALAREEEMA